VLAPWLPGYGATPLVSDDPSLERATRHLASDLHELGVEAVDVAGMSGGGYRAIALASRHPELVRSLFLMAGPARIDPPLADSLRATAAAVRSGTDISSALARSGLAPRFFDDHPEVVKALEDLVREVPGRTLAADLELMAGAPSLLEAVGKLDIPITVRVGDLDAMVPLARSEEILAVARRATLELVPGAGHVLLAEDADATFESIVRSLRA
jgi:pimeloyl-ACP methyl ester carboxylesterase